MARGVMRLKYHLVRLPEHDVMPCTISSVEVIQKALEAIDEKHRKIVARERALISDR